MIGQLGLRTFEGHEHHMRLGTQSLEDQWYVMPVMPVKVARYGAPCHDTGAGGLKDGAN